MNVLQACHADGQCGRDKASEDEILERITEKVGSLVEHIKTRCLSRNGSFRRLKNREGDKKTCSSTLKKSQRR